MKTYSPKISEVKRARHVIDARGQNLGRLASQIAPLLMGKHKPMYAPNLDTGDFVVVINAAQIAFTGVKKGTLKQYIWHTGFLGHLRNMSLNEMLEKHPTRAVEMAIKGMLPHTRLGARFYKKLEVYEGEIPKPKVKATPAKPATAEAAPLIEAASPTVKDEETKTGAQG
jgi:large subunit ribosomal protein L13